MEAFIFSFIMAMMTPTKPTVIGIQDGTSVSTQTSSQTIQTTDTPKPTPKNK